MQGLRLRAEIIDAFREFFRSRGSIEVETPAIVPSPGVDAHLDAIEVVLRPGGDDSRSTARWLATSPEYHMKRLLAAGSGPIHQLGKSWRDGERGRLHEPEFTLLEWYVPGADDDALMDQTEELVRDLAGRFAAGVLRHREAEANTRGEPFARMTFREAFQEHLGLDPIDDPERRLGLALRAAGVKAPRPADRDDLVDLLLAVVVQPKLGIGRPCFVTDWPESRAALARVRPGRDSDRRVSAARFELYSCGIELCNGYHELCDATEQRRRIGTENARRAALGKIPYPVDEEFLAALDCGLPDCAGNALGVDRLIMLLLGQESLGDVRSFLIDLP